MEDHDIFRYGITGVVAGIGLFLKRLWDKIEDSASKNDLASVAVKLESFAHKNEVESLREKVDSAVSKIDFDTTIRNLKVEHEADRRELRESIIKMFEKQEIQQQLLTTVATQIAMLLDASRQRRSGDLP